MAELQKTPVIGIDAEVSALGEFGLVAGPLDLLAAKPVGLVSTNLELLLDRDGHFERERGDRLHQQVADGAIQNCPDASEARDGSPPTSSTSEPSSYQRLREHLAYLQMTAVAEHLAVELDRGLKKKLSATQVLEQQLAIEVVATREHRQRGRLRFARYPVHKTLAEFDLDFQPGIDRKVVAELSTLRFVEERRNFILLGPPGVGKSHLAIALGVAATEAGYRTYFTAAATSCAPT